MTVYHMHCDPEVDFYHIQKADKTIASSRLILPPEKLKSLENLVAPKTITFHATNESPFVLLGI